LYPVRVQFTAKCWKPSRINIMQLVHKIKADSSASISPRQARNLIGTPSSNPAPVTKSLQKTPSCKNT
jgi:hypothetical protein